MTEAAPDPSLGVLLAAIQALGARLEHGLDQVHAQFEQVRADIADVRGDVAQVRADLAGVKTDTAYIERHVDDFQVWARRHEADPNAHRRAA
jgi:septal ring factor EnvC (AmiA/AmiB activator)